MVRYCLLWYVTVDCGTLVVVVVRYCLLLYVTVDCGTLLLVVVRWSLLLEYLYISVIL